MNVIEAWEGFTSSDKLMFQNCCRKLLKKTFLVRDKQDDRKHYFFVSNHIDVFLNYFSFMGFVVQCDKDSGVVMLDNGSSAGERDRLQSNRHRFTKEETIVLCCLWLIYMSRIKEGRLSSMVVVGMSEVVYELEKYNARAVIGKKSLENIFKVFRNYSLLDIVGNIGDIDYQLILYPSLQFVLDIGEFKRFVEEVAEIVLKEKDSLGEDSDEQNDDVE